MLSIRVMSETEAILDIDSCVHDGNCNEYVKFFSELIEGRYSLVTLNLAKLTTINTLTVEHIRIFEAMLSQKEKKLYIKGCNQKVLAMLQYSRIDQVIPIS